MLSPFTYIANNKRHIMGIAAIVALAVFCVSFVTALVGSVYSTAKQMVVSPFERFALVTYSGPDADRGLSNIQSLPTAEATILVAVSNITIRTTFGDSASYMLSFGSSSDLLDAVHRCGLEAEPSVLSSVSEGQMLVSANVMKNKKWNVGDNVSRFTIVGTLSGSTVVSMGLVSAAQIEAGSTSVATYMIFPRNGDVSALDQSLSQLSGTNWQIYTYDKAVNTLNDEFTTINLVLLLVVIMVASCLAIAMAALVFASYAARYDEFAILNAIGYRKRAIGLLVLEETLLLAAAAWVVGYGLSLLGLFLADTLIYARMGQVMSIVTLRGALYGLLIPVMVVVFAVLPTTRKLSKTDLVSVIERR